MLLLNYTSRYSRPETFYSQHYYRTPSSSLQGKKEDSKITEAESHLSIRQPAVN